MGCPCARVYSEDQNEVKPPLQEFTTLKQAMTYEFAAPMNGELRQNGASRGLDVMHGQAVHNGQTVFVDIELSFESDSDCIDDVIATPSST